MDRALDEIISEHQRNNNRGHRDRTRNIGPRDGIRKTTSRDTSRNIDRDWVHDKFDDDENDRKPRRNDRLSRRVSPEYDNSPSSSNFSNHTKLRIDNLHYDLTENDLSSLFSQLAPLPVPPTIRYDRAGRSTGVAFISYSSIAAARKAIREFDGANANGQPIYLTLLSAGADRTTGDRPGSRNPFETARMPPKSLFERVSSTRPLHSDDDNEDRQQDMPFEDDDLAAPSVRHSDVSGPAPKGIDRYIPGRHSQNSRRSRSPRERRTGHSGSGDSAGRRPGTRRETHNRDGTQRNDRSGTGNTKGGNQRPRKTQDELDREMDDYWVGGRGNGDGGSESLPATSNGHEAVTTVETEEDIDMGIE